jgi:hypothetical protein
MFMMPIMALGVACMWQRERDDVLEVVAGESEAPVSYGSGE